MTSWYFSVLVDRLTQVSNYIEKGQAGQAYHGNGVDRNCKSRNHVCWLGLIHVAYDPGSLDSDAARRRMEEALRVNAARPLFTGTAVGHFVPK